ncbi:hypothetical protein NHH73_02820 [Oxalobacteraceae bacterium OTU3CINTB1]|nr:hypothetical protein NHH73_02820 [Oxalobacteraceae bacterium OTU3CINTB1]
MLFRNDIFELENTRCRLLHVDNNSCQAWAISIDSDAETMPIRLPMHLVAELMPSTQPAVDLNLLSAPSRAMLASQQRAMVIVGNLPEQVPFIFEPKARSAIIRTHSEKTGYSRKAIYKNLRRYWVGGQTASALLPHFRKSGATTKLTNAVDRRDGTPLISYRKTTSRYFGAQSSNTLTISD